MALRSHPGVRDMGRISMMSSEVVRGDGGGERTCASSVTVLDRPSPLHYERSLRSSRQQSPRTSSSRSLRPLARPIRSRSSSRRCRPLSSRRRGPSSCLLRWQASAVNECAARGVEDDDGELVQSRAWFLICRQRRQVNGFLQSALQCPLSRQRWQVRSLCLTKFIFPGVENVGADLRLDC